MELIKAINRLTSIPIPLHALNGLLGDYKEPNDKIRDLVEKGILERVVKGLFIGGPSLDVKRPHPFLLANQILGPSYVSMESALSYYGLIPERVYTVTSMTIKAAREYRTAVGNFSYTKLPLSYYNFGVERVKLSAEQTVQLGSPQKALIDKIIDTTHVQFRSKADVYSYLEKDLRIDVGSLQRYDWAAVETWLIELPKKKSISLLLQTLQSI